MKRDMDIVRLILLAIENQSLSESNAAFAPKGLSQEAIEIHVPILIDKDLIEAKDWSISGQRIWAMVRLTWQGHDFLDTIRDEAIWKATKDGVSKAGGFSLDLMKALATGLIKKKIEQHTGVELDLG